MDSILVATTTAAMDLSPVNQHLHVYAQKKLSIQNESKTTNNTGKDTRITSTLEPVKKLYNMSICSGGKLDDCNIVEKSNHVLSFGLESENENDVNAAFRTNDSNQCSIVSISSLNQNDITEKTASHVSLPPVTSREIKHVKRSHGFIASFPFENVTSVDCNSQKPREIVCPLLHLASISSKMHDDEIKKQQHRFTEDFDVRAEQDFYSKRQKLLHNTSPDSSIPLYHSIQEHVDDVGSSETMTSNSFIQNVYVDYSKAQIITKESSEYKDSVSNRVMSTFPVKLHSALEKIESDGHADIIGWLPHGRSFKIHKHKEFAEFILPKYFLMTKKSSFLRQLNLYSFNRISTGSRIKKSKNAVSDQNSYYHERFLRGLPHVCKTMKRMKVNGNGIRTAGNPDYEPQFTKFPSCPSRNGLTLLDDNCSLGIETESNISVGKDSNNANERMEKVASLFLITPEKKTLSLTTCTKKYEHKIVANLDISSKVAPVASDGLNLLVSLLPDISNIRTSSVLEHAGHTDCVTSSTPNDEMEVLTDQSEYSVSVSGNDNTLLCQSSKSDCDLASGCQESSNGNNFPLKLHRILERLESEQSYDIISWLPHGKSFKVHDVNRFVNELMKKYFHQTKYSSFQRQLHMYNFQRITSKSNKDKGSYHHPSFIRGEPDNAASMQRTRVNGKGTRKPGNPLLEPNFT